MSSQVALLGSHLVEPPGFESRETHKQGGPHGGSELVVLRWGVCGLPSSHGLVKNQLFICRGEGVASAFLRGVKVPQGDAKQFNGKGLYVVFEP